MRRRFTRLALGASLAVGSLGALGVFGMQSAHAVGPAGTTCLGPHGFLAAGTVTDGPTPGGPPAPTVNCAPFTEVAGGQGGGWVGGDSVAWSVTTNILVAQDINKQPCGFVATGTGTFVASGKGPASGGVGCLAPGANVSVTAS